METMIKMSLKRAENSFAVPVFSVNTELIFYFVSFLVVLYLCNGFYLNWNPIMYNFTVTHIYLFWSYQFMVTTPCSGASTELKSRLVTLCINIGSGSGHEVSEWTLRQQSLVSSHTSDVTLAPIMWRVTSVTRWRRWISSTSMWRPRVRFAK